MEKRSSPNMTQIMLKKLKMNKTKMEKQLAVIVIWTSSRKWNPMEAKI